MPAPLAPPWNREESYRRYVAGLLTNNRSQCQAEFEGWLAATPDLRELYEGLVQRSLYEVGELWEQGKISVASEHAATAMNESLLQLAYPRIFAQPRSGKAAVIASSAAEYHQLGAKLVADLFELNGWRGYFAGANTTLPDLLSLIRDKRPEAVALSLTLYFNLESLLQTANAIRAEFPEVPILAGGQAFRRGGREQVEQLPGVHCLASLAELEAWIKRH